LRFQAARVGVSDRRAQGYRLNPPRSAWPRV
jgi:hypothetical protein